MAMHGTGTGKWVEEELRAIDSDFTQDKMNAFGSVEDTVIDHVDELVSFTSNLLLIHSRNVTQQNANYKEGDDFMAGDMSEAKFEELASDFRSKQQDVEELSTLMTRISAKVAMINDCINSCSELEDD
eukprot:TRINITY_DN14473_c0_g1_i1.p1 TRINITY_DN14473_c0_g1~~TRINITY_DN14473_c0_g1_i1.p1  ORF type:complete len:128 (+),score=33.46 TRINITY_DN14473_c0_g1_i1:146-529(+)